VDASHGATKTAQSDEDEATKRTRLGKLKVADLKTLLLEENLPRSGKKSTLVDRLIQGVPKNVAPADEHNVHYDYDCTHPPTKPMILGAAKTSKAKCIRCYCAIQQAQKIVKFGTWRKTPFGNAYIHRMYHVEC